ncbi:AP-4 complex accessory subunit tepsin-like [Oopsacas minuta]|uniref:AP-4 complex accessory subunit tepsin-like n=1 Tax=Oopsacas minuta TaxID=111878 RepID=A0AAV7JZ34_9METZ|nr:AP-4 complex accessory subunit tepsin-like [Oopsacas minuta]
MLDSSGIKDKMSNLTDFPILSAATHSDPNPTPVHLSQRIVSISFVSRQKCVHLMEYFLELANSANKSIHSRIKAVRLMQELVVKGDTEFRPLLQKEEHKLKSISGFLDPRAPLESSRLREATNGLLEVLFEETETPVPPSRPNPTIIYGPPSTSYNKPQYKGFGNPNFSQNRAVPANSGILNLVTDKVVGLLNYTPGTNPDRFPRYSDRQDMNQASSYAENQLCYPGVPRHTYSAEPMLPDIRPHQPGVASAEWEQGTYPDVTRSSNTVEVRGDGYLERQLVVAFTTEAGIRNKPTRQELDELVTRSRSLDCSAIATELILQLDPVATSSRMKTLFAIETLYRSFPAQVADVITNNSQPISCLAQKGEGPIKNKSKEILLLLGISNEDNSDVIEMQKDTVDIPKQSDTLLWENEQSTNSLFDGMLTSHTDVTNPQTTATGLIPGLEDIEIPEVNDNQLLNTDMIDFGSSKTSIIFDPLLDTEISTSTTLPPINSTIPKYTNTPYMNSNTPSNSITYNTQSTNQNEKRDSFGFISDHIQTLKHSK